MLEEFEIQRNGRETSVQQSFGTTTRTFTILIGDDHEMFVTDDAAPKDGEPENEGGDDARLFRE